jgi:hypothetical protein
MLTILITVLGCTQPLPSENVPPSYEDIQDTEAAHEEQGDSGNRTSFSEELTVNIDLETVHVNMLDNQGVRSYTLRSSRLPSETRQFSESDEDPKLRSGNLLTDALFAMAVIETKENSVSQISDAAFSEMVDCECYKTGAEWNWVWTRDIGYAVDLGLKHIDPDRSWNSLWFKTSERKIGGRREIIQDTGTAGSWPVSTDRVVWTRGAMELWRQHRDPLIKEQLVDVLRNTVETDLQYVFDSRDGLYRGETSFLDWRSQTYPQWMIDTPSHIAMSKSLSTNLNHLYTLRALEELTEEHWGSTSLATAIDEHFWTGTHYSSFIATELHAQPVHQQDLLATSLAVLELGTHPEALTQYPHTQYGAPVIHPQQQRIPIYHNRANWPFVSAYALLAARQSNQGTIFETHLNALIQGAALNLSNMENWEVQTGKTWVDDGEYSGPVINSKRQLWSVAGFIGAIVEGVFGIHQRNGEWTANPILPKAWFTANATLQIHGQTFSIGNTHLNDGEIAWLQTNDWKDIYAPTVPTVSLILNDDGIIVDPTPLEDGVAFELFKEGTPWNPTTNVPSDTPIESTCYSLQTHFEGYRNRSHPAEPICWWGEEYSNIQSLYMDDITVSGGTYSTTHGRPHYDNWGSADHTITGSFTPTHTGRHFFQVVYGNGSGGLDSGITCAVKWVRIRNASEQIITEKALIMPQLDDWDRWSESNLISFDANNDETISFEILEGLNMSFFDHYAKYNGNGGGNDMYNFVNISEIKILFRNSHEENN